MRKLRWVALSIALALVLPVLAACDSGTPATPVPTTIPTEISSVAVQTATALPATTSEAATAVATAAGGTLSPQDTAYLNKVSDLATKLQNSQEIADATKATGDAASQALIGGNVDTNALTDKLNKAVTFVNGIADQATVLNPPADLQSVQDQLVKSVNSYQSTLTSAQSAIANQNWTDAGTAIAGIAQAATDLANLTADLAARSGR